MVASQELAPQRLAQHLSVLPHDCRVLDPVLTIAAAASGREPFIRPPQDQAEHFMAERARLANAKGQGDPHSDHMALAMAYRAFTVATDRDRWNRNPYVAGAFAHGVCFSLRALSGAGC
jgi:HrpA-like RNA helicase